MDIEYELRKALRNNTNKGYNNENEILPCPIKVYHVYYLSIHKYNRRI